ncbi:hypothetical protein [Streptomyces sp. NPDC051567]|uniref:hypothetical protein n=1 Tax=Streptomyces sp. NPDC051567 TaxID=3365660 RepID=UPI0037AF35E0
MPEPFGHLPHPLPRTRVRDLTSGAEGTLTAVVHQNLSDAPARPHWAELACIRAPSGLEWSTALDNIEPAR